jgi:hypothetical protein
MLSPFAVIFIGSLLGAAKFRGVSHPPPAAATA